MIIYIVSFWHILFFEVQVLFKFVISSKSHRLFYTRAHKCLLKCMNFMAIRGIFISVLGNPFTELTIT